jgi:hypothetical protein
MPWRRIARKPITSPIAAAAAVPARIASSGGQPQIFAAWAVT